MAGGRRRLGGVRRGRPAPRRRRRRRPPPARPATHVVGANGGVFGFGGAALYGSPAASQTTLSSPVVGIAETPTGKGYWLVGADGGVFTYGDAGYFGSVPAVTTKKLAAADRRAWRPRRPARATGSWAPTAACSPSATPATTGRCRPCT